MFRAVESTTGHLPKSATPLLPNTRVICGFCPSPSLRVPLLSCDRLFDEPRGLGERRELNLGHRPQELHKGFDAQTTATFKGGFPLGRGAKLDRPLIVLVGPPRKKTLGFQAGSDSAHGWGRHLLSFGQLTQRPRPAEDQDRKGGQSRRADPSGDVRLAQSPQEMYRCGMKSIRHITPVDSSTSSCCTTRAMRTTRATTTTRATRTTRITTTTPATTVTRIATRTRITTIIRITTITPCAMRTTRTTTIRRRATRCTLTNPTPFSHRHA